MLLEFRPLMCPTDATKTNAAFYLSLFLPTKGERGKESQTYMYIFIFFIVLYIFFILLIYLYFIKYNERI